jgi:hypothetical protein
MAGIIAVLAAIEPTLTEYVKARPDTGITVTTPAGKVEIRGSIDVDAAKRLLQDLQESKQPERREQTAPDVHETE